MEFRVLGPLEVREAGRSSPLGGVKQRALLAILLLHANDLVSSDRLVEELWGEEPPETARNVIQVYVSQIRKILASSGSGGRTSLVTRQPGYVLEVGEDDYDLARFERLTAKALTALLAGDPETAARLYDESLRLWRGDPLADFRLEPFAQAEIDRLEGLRLEASENLVEARLLLGQGAQMVPELEALVAAHPLSERLRADLMHALYQAGRQADALEAYRIGADRLAEELGIDPGPALQHLQAAILRQDPSLGTSGDPISEASASWLPGRVPVVVLAATGGVTELLDLVERVGVPAGATVWAGSHGEVFASFGHPVVVEDGPERAAMVAVSLVRRGSPPAVGLASGRIDLGASDNDLAPLAERAATLAVAPGEVALDERTARRLRSQFSIGADGDQHRLRPPAGTNAEPPTSPLVGRARELDGLRDVLDGLDQGRGCVVLIDGHTGMGKTRMLWEMRALARSSQTWLQGSCAISWMSTPYLALADAIRGFADVEPTDSDPDTRALMLAALRDVVDDPASVMDSLSPLLGADDEGGHEPSDRIVAGLTRLLEGLTRGGSVVLAIDDQHEIDPPTAGVLRELLEMTDRLPVCIVLAARAEPESAAWPLRLHAEAGYRHRLVHLELAPLNDDESGELADAISPTGAIESGSRAEIVARAAGNPLYIEEITRSLVEGDGLVRQRGWTLSLTTAAALMPPRIDDLLAARLRRLPEDAGRLAAAAAVIGDDASVTLLARIAGVDDAVRATTALLRAEIMREVRRGPDLHVRFTHVLFREAALASLTPARAAEMYGRAADELVVANAGQAERVAFYRYRAGDWREAHRALTVSATDAESTSAAHASDLWALAARAAERAEDPVAAAHARAEADRLGAAADEGQAPA